MMDKGSLFIPNKPIIPNIEIMTEGFKVVCQSLKKLMLMTKRKNLFVEDVSKRIAELL
jgi:hypothetical protein